MHEECEPSASSPASCTPSFCRCFFAQASPVSSDGFPLGNAITLAARHEETFGLDLSQEATILDSLTETFQQAFLAFTIP